MRTLIPVILFTLAIAVYAMATPSIIPTEPMTIAFTSRDLNKALEEAGSNKPQMEAALKAVKPEQRKAMEFLIINMPVSDLKTLTKDYLVENVEFAYKARKEMKWGKDIPEDLFINYVVPYANITERRDNWRKDFYNRFKDVVKDCKTMEEAVLKLNKDVFEILNVKYHATLRKKPNQSPYESIEAGYASCSGLSVLITDVCRALCIPSRLAGVLTWANKPENHIWSEVWTHEWRYIGAGEPNDLDVAWFSEISTKIDPNNPEYGVYALSFQRTNLCYPPAWRYARSQVFAENITPFYTSRRNVKLSLAKEGGKACKAKVTLKLDGKIVAEKVVDGSGSFIIPGGKSYDAEITETKGSKTVTKKIEVPDQDDQMILLSLS